MWALICRFCFLIMVFGHVSAQLSVDFYKNTCANPEIIVRKAMIKKYQQTPVAAAGTLRVFFHDCMVEGSIAIMSAPYTGASQSVHPQMPWLSRSTLLNSKVYHSMSRCQMLAPKVINTASPHSLMVIYAEAVDRRHLKDLPMHNYINNDGMILPPVEPGTAATVFAVFDNAKKAQYVGFSKDIRNSLRTLIGLRPEFCHFYKLYNLPTFDQQKMLSIRQQWFSKLGSAPRGNTDSVQRNMWEKPADAGSISEKGKLAAATSRAKTLLQTMMDKGLKEKVACSLVVFEDSTDVVSPIYFPLYQDIVPLFHLHPDGRRRKALTKILFYSCSYSTLVTLTKSACLTCPFTW